MATIWWKLNQTEDTVQAAHAQARVMDKEAHLLLMERKDTQIQEIRKALEDCGIQLELAKQNRDEAERVVTIYKMALVIATVLGLIGWAV